MALRIDGIGKRYRLQPSRAGRTLDARVDGDTLWALRQVTLEASAGDVVGIIGGNGSGKSTLLKILARVVEPSEGRAEIRGRVGSLLEVGAGFNPELTGRENVLLNGAILGFTRAETEGRLESIIRFAELENFVDEPVKHYSTGMHLRLGFAVAAHLDCDVFIVDEALAVGDEPFQRKCLAKIKALAQEGKTILFVSHNLQFVRTLCTRVVWLEAGRVRAIGPPEQTVQNYLDAYAAEQRRATERVTTAS